MPGIGKNSPCPQGAQPRRTDGQAVLEPTFQIAVTLTLHGPSLFLSHLSREPGLVLSHTPSCEGSAYTRYYGKTLPEKDSVGLFEELIPELHHKEGPFHLHFLMQLCYSLKCGHFSLSHLRSTF